MTTSTSLGRVQPQSSYCAKTIRTNIHRCPGTHSYILSKLEQCLVHEIAHHLKSKDSNQESLNKKVQCSNHYASVLLLECGVCDREDLPSFHTGVLLCSSRRFSMFLRFHRSIRPSCSFVTDNRTSSWHSFTMEHIYLKGKKGNGLVLCT